MKIIRRAYTYLIALISLEVVVWGLINLLRTIFGNGLAFPSANTLSMALALILVGVPVFAGHWFWIQRNEEEFEERTSYLRGLFFYGAFGGIFVPVAQNALALVNRGALALFKIETHLAFIGGAQSTLDNLIAIFVNLLLGFYLFRVYTQTSEEKIREHFTEISRLHGYLWVFYALFFILIGSQQMLRFLMVSENAIINGRGFSPLVNGLSLAIVGVPLWVSFWSFRQKKDFEEDKNPSPVRLTFLFLFSFLGIIVTLVTASLSAYPLLQVALRDPQGTADLITRIANPLSIGLPVAVFWFYFHRWLKLDIETKYAPSEKRGISRFYAALLSVIGLGATLTGLSIFLSVFASFLYGDSIFSDALRGKLSSSLATLFTGLPLWLLFWRELDNPEKEHVLENTSSITRRAYLYIAIFGTVIASMISAITLAYKVLFGLFGQHKPIFGSDELASLLLTIEFVIFAIYHWRAIRVDNLFLRENESKQAPFSKGIVLVGYSKTIADEIVGSVKTRIPEARIRVVSTSELKKGTIDSDEIVFLSLDEVGYTAENLSPNNPILVQTTGSFNHANELRSDDAQTAVKAILALLQGKSLPGKTKSLPWQIVAYIMAALFTIEILFTLVTLIVSSF